jgi:signal transduction histidine kinase
MPTHSAIEPAPRDEFISSAAKRLWFGWTDREVGVLMLLLVLVPSLLTIWGMQRRSRAILTDTIKGDLMSAAMVMANQVDAAAHTTFHDPVQEKDEAYQQQIAKFTKMRPAVDPKGLIKFVYTCVEQDGRIYFVLDDTPAGDANGDGIDDKAHIMEQYTDASDAVREVFKHHAPTVSAAPYTDKWGSFLSGYAPIFDSEQNMVGALGVDLAMQAYDLELSAIYRLTTISSVTAVLVAMLSAWSMAFYHRRLKRSIGELVTMGDAALAASKAKSDFLASMSHELRTPLHAIVGHTELLMGESLSPAQSGSAGEIRVAAEKLEGMVSDILDYSQMETGGLNHATKPMALRETIADLHAHFTEEAGAKGIKFDLHVADECPSRILTDPVRFRQMLRHLISNAIKFTSAGRIDIMVRLQNPAELHIEVRDQGAGITQEQREQLFEVFSMGDASSTRAHGGMGVGLALCKRICEGLKGRLTVETEVGKGSSFHLFLPLAEAPPAGDVWLVSVDKFVSMLVRSIVEKAGRKLVLVSAAEAVHWRQGDLVLFDVGSLPAQDIDGVSVVALNVELSTRLPANCVEVLTFPVKPAEVRRVIEVF